MSTEFHMRELGLVRLECGDELETLHRVARLTPETIAMLRDYEITTWHRLLHSGHGELLNRGMLAAYVHHLDKVLAQVGWSFGMSEAEIIRQLNLTILPADIFLNCPSPSR